MHITKYLYEKFRKMQRTVINLHIFCINMRREHVYSILLHFVTGNKKLIRHDLNSCRMRKICQQRNYFTCRLFSAAEYSEQVEEEVDEIKIE